MGVHGTQRVSCDASLGKLDFLQLSTASSAQNPPLANAISGLRPIGFSDGEKNNVFARVLLFRDHLLIAPVDVTDAL